MQFVARLQESGADQAMLLFQLRRVGAKGEFVAPPNGGGDVQLLGEVPDEKVPDLVAALAKTEGAVHAGDRHFTLHRGEAKPAASIEEAEAHLGGPYTVPGTTRADWSFGGDRTDHLVQVLYFEDGELAPNELREKTGYPIDQVMTALKKLATDEVVRRYRREGEGGGTRETYGLARAVRERLAAKVSAPA